MNESTTTTHAFLDTAEAERYARTMGMIAARREKLAAERAQREESRAEHERTMFRLDTSRQAEEDALLASMAAAPTQAELEAEVAGLRAELGDAESLMETVRAWAKAEVDKAADAEAATDFAEGFAEAQDLCAVAVLDLLAATSTSIEIDETVLTANHPAAQATGACKLLAEETK